MSAPSRFYREQAIDLAARPELVFDVLNDHNRLVAHMGKPSLMMAGGSMKVETDSRRGQAVGSVIRMAGRVLGIPLRLEEVVVDYEPPFRKTWETCGEPNLLVIGSYRMGFELTPGSGSGSGQTRLRVWIDYDLPSRIPMRWLGRFFGTSYADWCVGEMIWDARQAFTRQDRT